MLKVKLSHETATEKEGIFNFYKDQTHSETLEDYFVDVKKSQNDSHRKTFRRSASFESLTKFYKLHVLKIVTLTGRVANHATCVEMVWAVISASLGATRLNF